MPEHPISPDVVTRPMVRMDSRMPAIESWFNSSVRSPSRRSFAAKSMGFLMMSTTSGLRATMRSKSGWMKVPTFGFFIASGGNRQNVVTPATLGPSPSA